MKKNFIPRDVSWLSFNSRVLQEARDPSVPLQQRIHFLGIFSNNMDEFFRVRVPALQKMVELGNKKSKFRLEEKPQQILQQIHQLVLEQQTEFDKIYASIFRELKKQKIFIINEKKLNAAQQKFVKKFFEDEVSSNIIPLFIESLPQLPYIWDKSIFLGVVMRKKNHPHDYKYALIEIPSKPLSRFVILPSAPGETRIILLEDVIRFNLPYIFSYFAYDQFTAHMFKLTKDAEIDIDNDIATTLVQKIQRGVMNRKKGKTVRFVYDKAMDTGLLAYLIEKLQLTEQDNIIPGGPIRNFRDFMEFPQVFPPAELHPPAFTHPALVKSLRVSDVILQRDIMLHFPYHSFNSVIDLLREAAMDPDVKTIKMTAYRLASNSKVVNALINAVRNGKQVVVVLELKARFDEAANLEWKEKLEEEGVRVLLGIPDMKVHAKLCVIKKQIGEKIIQYGFISTGNLNERTARVYVDMCLLTSDANIMADINRIFKCLEEPLVNIKNLTACKTLLVSPATLRLKLLAMIDKEIKLAKAHKPAKILLNLNSLSDLVMVNKLYEAAEQGVKITMIVRGIFCALVYHKKFKQPMRAISIVDQYLEHARVFIFHNGGKEKVYVSSADWMARNLDHRVEVAVPITDKTIITELKDIIEIKLSDNVKARILDNELSNNYITTDGKPIRSQIEIYKYLKKKKLNNREDMRHG